MIRAKTLSIFLLFMVCIANVQASNNQLTAQQAQSQLQLSSPSELSGKFTQKKYFKVLKKPFISTGEFKLKDQKFSWLTLSPAKSGIVYQQQRLFLQDANGALKAAPQADGFSQLILHLITGDFNGLSSQFTFHQTKQPQCILLTPTDPQLKSIFAQVTLCAKSAKGVVSSLSLLDSNSNKTDISLTYP